MNWMLIIGVIVIFFTLAILNVLKHKNRKLGGEVINAHNLYETTDPYRK